MANSQTQSGVEVWGDPIDAAVEQAAAVLRHASLNEEPLARVALMADHHIGYSVPIGGVVAYTNHVSPSGVGYDIACGNKAIRLDLDPEDVVPHIPAIMDRVVREVSFGVGRVNNNSDDPFLAEQWRSVVDHTAWEIPALRDMKVGKGQNQTLKQMARAQLGTVGSGNHYVDVFVGDDNYVWVGVHFGSRGLGHKITAHYLREGGGQANMHSDPTLFHVGDLMGVEYMAAMQLAGKYAYAGRNWVCDIVRRIIGEEVGRPARELRAVHNHHNYTWYERDLGAYVVRKGATPNYPGQYSFIGGSMGDQSVIVTGMENPEMQRRSLYSTVHGAGRVMGRKQAKRELTDDEWWAWLLAFEMNHGYPLEIRGGGLDEAPQAYKRLPEVLSYHAPTTKVCVNLTPVGVAMADANEFDPYKD